ncbi:MAG: sodium-translocating pyrophosphatase [Actinobacteria bacterium]|nr:sodium-translocating pyrophosphatase [Actinomycetota bacterium]
MDGTALYLAAGESTSLDLPALSGFENTMLYVILGISLVALIYAYSLVRGVLAKDEGTEQMRDISLAIREGANAYLTRQFKTLAFFVVVITFVLMLLEAPTFGIRVARSVAFLLGAVFSATVGFVGMGLAVRANVRVASAARRGLRESMGIAFRAGGVAGMFTVGLGLFGATLIFIIYKGDAPLVLFGFGFGGALLAMFMRVGGGIFTKAADVGADLVGKVEQNIPEDDPRNAATIADNVGDNVGDCAGMAADLFESYEVTLVAALILGFVAYQGTGSVVAAVLFPLFVRAIGVITSIIGIEAVKPRSETEHGMKAINRGFVLSGVASAIAVFFVSAFYVGDIKTFWAVVIGLVLAAAIHFLTEYYTSTERKPVQEIARATRTGPATTLISGFAIGMESTVANVITISAAIFAAFLLGGGDADLSLYYIALTGMGMLTTVGVIVSMDTYGPVSDNAHGVAEMAGGLGEEADKTMADLDSVGNTTKAITKGLAIATAVLAATSLFGSFQDIIGNRPIDISSPDVLVGLLIGAAVPWLFGSLTIRAVGRAAGTVVLEVRNQFKNNPGIMDYSVKPDYARVVDICTKTSLRELVSPGLLAIVTPIVVGFAFGAIPLGAYLAGAIVSGQLLAVMLANSGGAWDNAKKTIEDGLYGGKNSPAHEAGVIGDTVGDPFKDTAGPALNPLIKVMNLVALLVAASIVSAVDNGNTGLRAVVVALGLAILAGALYFSSQQEEADFGEDTPTPVAEDQPVAV